jgi:hypothetical protein
MKCYATTSRAIHVERELKAKPNGHPDLRKKPRKPITFTLGLASERCCNLDRAASCQPGPIGSGG